MQLTADSIYKLGVVQFTYEENPQKVISIPSNINHHNLKQTCTTSISVFLNHHWRSHTEGISLHKEDLIPMDNKSHNPKLAQCIALIIPSFFIINPTTSTPIMILDPMLPAHGSCSADSANIIFGRQCFIPCKISDIKNL